MKFFSKSKDGGPESHVDAFFIVEIKSLFSIVLLRFNQGTREAFHSHAFNAWTYWIHGMVLEEFPDGKGRPWWKGDWKYTPRRLMHKVRAVTTSYALSFRGPWVDRWQENVDGKLVTLTHGRKICASEPIADTTKSTN
jgi:hypothetical protein